MEQVVEEKLYHSMEKDYCYFLQILDDYEKCPDVLRADDDLL